MAYSIMDATPPENKAVAKTLEVVKNNPEMVKSVQKQCIENAQRFKREEESEAQLSAIEDTVSMAEYVYNVRKDLYQKLWNGTITPEELEMLRPDYFNFQDLLAHQQLQAIDEEFIAENMQNVVMVYDVSQDSEFIRGYISEGRQLDPNNSKDKKIIDLYDQCFHSWLVDNKMSSQDGVIYNINKLDKKGNYVEKSKPEDVMRLLESEDRGLKFAVDKQSKDLNLEVVRNQPAASPEPEAGAGT